MARDVTVGGEILEPRLIELPGGPRVSDVGGAGLA